MKTKLITSTDAEELARQLNYTLENKFNATLYYSSCPYGTDGVIMYSVLVVWK